jgi:hypothetical protein
MQAGSSDSEVKLHHWHNTYVHQQRTTQAHACDTPVIIVPVELPYCQFVDSPYKHPKLKATIIELQRHVE